MRFERAIVIVASLLVSFATAKGAERTVTPVPDPLDCTATRTLCSPGSAGSCPDIVYYQTTDASGQCIQNVCYLVGEVDYDDGTVYCRYGNCSSNYCVTV